MVKLTVAASRPGQPPPVGFHQFDRIPDFHQKPFCVNFCVKRYGNQRELTGRRKGEIDDFVAVRDRGIP
jgi:hypothetical protein